MFFLAILAFLLVSFIVGEAIDGGPVSPYDWRPPLEPFCTGMLIVAGGIVLGGAMWLFVTMWWVG